MAVVTVVKMLSKNLVMIVDHILERPKLRRDYHFRAVVVVGGVRIATDLMIGEATAKVRFQVDEHLEQIL